MNPRVLKSGKHDEAFYKNLWSVLSAGNTWQGEFCNRKKNGDLYWESASISPMRNHLGITTHYVAVKENITPLRQAAMENQNILQSALDAFWINNPLGDFLEVNQAFCDMSGYSREELLQMHLSDIEASEDSGAIKAHIEKIIHRGFDRFETMHRKKNGDIINVEANVRFLNIRGGVFMVFCKDITQQKKFEKEILESKGEAEMANRAKSDFLASMSHEIRTPLNAILGMTYLALQTDLSPKQKNYCQKIQNSGKLLLGIISDILDFSKIEAGKLDIEQVTFSLEKVLDDIKNLISEEARKKNLELVFHVSPSLPRLFAGDPLRISQVLTNLLNNAVKFTPSGTVSLEVGQNFQEKNLGTRFIVKDTGIGVSREVLDRLFQPFSQADSSTTRKYGGTGLGLSIAKKLVALMGGELQVESEEGKGSHFFFDLPLTATDQTALPEHSNPVLTTQSNPPAAMVNTDEWSVSPGNNQPTEGLPDLSAFRGARILLVDDNEINREFTCELLNHLGFTVVAAHDGQEALDKLQTEIPDAVLMDIQMPGIDGYQATSLIRRDPRCSTLPIIAMTANALSGDREKALEAGMNDHISKPLAPQVLVNSLKTLIPATLRKPVESTPWSDPPQTTQKGDLEDDEFGTLDSPVDIPGVDVQKSLSRLGGNWHSYQRLLKKFIKDQQNFPGKMDRALDTKDWQEVRFLVHRLRGIAGNLGMMDLLKFCAEAETSVVSARELLPTSIPQVKSELSKTISLIQGVFLKFGSKKSPPKTEQLTEAEKLQLSEKLDFLKELLKKSDFRALRSYEELQSFLGPYPALKKKLAEFGKNIHGFDYEGALAKLEAVYEFFVSHVKIPGKNQPKKPDQD